MRDATCALMLALAVVVDPVAAATPTLSKSLAVLAPLVGRTWRGQLRDPASGRGLPTEQRYEVLGAGAVVKLVSSTPALGQRSEGYLYWDRDAGAIAWFGIDERGIHTRGVVSMADSVLTVTGRISFSERSFDFGNTFEFPGPGRMIDRWFQNAFGDWRAGHVIEFEAVTPE